MNRYDQDSSIAQKFQGAMELQSGAPFIQSCPADKEYPLRLGVKVGEDQYLMIRMDPDGAREFAAGLIEAAEWAERHAK